MAVTINYKCTDGGLLGVQGFTNVDSTQQFPLGKVASGNDAGSSAFGDADFIYMKAGGTIVAGDFCAIDRGAKTAVQASTATPKGTIAIAMAGMVNGQYGWFMLRGMHDGANVATGVAAGTPLYLTATAGRPNGTVVAGNKIDQAFERNGASAGNVGVAEVNWAGWTGNG